MCGCACPGFISGKELVSEQTILQHGQHCLSSGWQFHFGIALINMVTKCNVWGKALIHLTDYSPSWKPGQELKAGAEAMVDAAHQLAPEFSQGIFFFTQHKTSCPGLAPSTGVWHTDTLRGQFSGGSSSTDSFLSVSSWQPSLAITVVSCLLSLICIKYV